MWKQSIHVLKHRQMAEYLTPCIICQCMREHVGCRDLHLVYADEWPSRWSPWARAGGAVVECRGRARAPAPPSPPARCAPAPPLQGTCTHVTPPLPGTHRLYSPSHSPFLKNTFNLSWSDFVSRSLEPMARLSRRWLPLRLRYELWLGTITYECENVSKKTYLLKNTITTAPLCYSPFDRSLALTADRSRPLFARF